MHVSRTIDRASRGGTPELISVPSVRMVRAMIVFCTMPPEMGMVSLIQSSMYAPRRLRRISLRMSQMAIGTSGMMYQNLTKDRDVSMRTCVIHGSLMPKSLKIFSSLRMMKIMMNVRMATATLMTTAGYIMAPLILRARLMDFSL